MISYLQVRTIWQRLACCALVLMGCAVFAAANGPVAHAEPLPGFTEVSGSPFALPDTTRVPAMLALGFTADGRWLVTATDLRVYLFAVSRDGNLRPQASWAPSSGGGIERLAIEPAQNLVSVLVNGDSATLTTLAIASSGELTPISSVTVPNTGGASIAFSGDGSLLAVGFNDLHPDMRPDYVALFAVGADGALNPRPVGQAPVVAPTSLAFDPTGRFLAVADADGDGDDTLTIFAISAGVPTFASSALTGADPFSVTVSADGFVATANLADRSVSEFALDTAGHLREVAGSPFPMAEPPRAVAYSPSSSLVAVGDWAGDLQLLTVGAAGQLDPAPGETYSGDGTVRALAFGADGGLLADLDGNGYIHMFAVGAPTATINAPQPGDTTYTIGAPVPTHFSCTDSQYAPGIAGCFDSNGGKAPTGSLDTVTVGKHTYSVTATSRDGQSSTASIEYTVTRIPTRVTATPLDLGRWSTTANLTNANTGGPLGGKTLRFDVAGKTVCAVITDSKGYATCKFPLTAVVSALLAGQYQVSYTGDATYAPTTTTVSSIPA